MTVRFAAGVLLGALAGCSVEAGATCLAAGEARCDGSARMLLCQERTWKAIACDGPAGCASDGRFVECDESRAVVGSPCGADPVSHSSCTRDGSELLECREGSWRTSATCGGPRGCKVSADRRFADCDDSLGVVDDACTSEGNLACSSDGREILRCSRGRMVSDEVCAGECVVADNSVACSASE